MSSEPSDLAELIAATARGDRLAFRRLYDATAPKLLGILSRMMSSRAEAEDVLQDVYIRVWHNAGRFSADVGAPFAWLTTIARNRAIDVLRAKVPTVQRKSEDVADPLEQIADGGDDEAQLTARDGLTKCLATLDPQARDMIVRAYCHGDSRDELALRYGRPVNTIKTVLHRGLAALKACLGGSR